MYGLAYFTMGLAVWVKIRPLLDNRLARVFGWLVAFGLLHAIHEWMEMFVIMGHAGSDILVVSILIVALSYAALFQFGVEFMGLKKNLPRITRLCPAILLFLWFLFYLKAFSYDEGMRLAEIWSRYILGFPGTLLTAYALTRKRKEVTDSPYVSRNLLWAGIFFGFYGFFTIIVPETDFFPTSFLNSPRFANLVGIPIQIFRMLSAVTITYFIVQSLDVFDVLEKRKLIDQVREMTGDLEESEEKYRTLFELAGDAFLTVIPPRGEIVDTNKAAAQMLGYLKEEMRKLSGSDIIAPVVLEETNSELEKQVEERGYFLLETIWKRKDGSQFPVEISGRPLEIRGQLLFQLIGRDITERRQAEEALKDSESKYRSLFENANDAIIIFEPVNEIILEANTKVFEIYGFSRDEFIGMNLKEISKEVTTGEKRIRQVLRKGTIDNFKTVHIKKDGTPINILVNASTIEYEGKQAILSINRDITEYMRVEEALRTSEEKFRNLFDHASDAIFIHDMEGHFLEVNRMAYQRLGYKKGQLLQMTPMDIDAPEYAALIRSRIEELRQEGHVIFESVHVRQDGKTIPVEISSRTIEYRGEPAILSIARDITDRKQAQEILQRSEEEYRVLSQQLMEANNMKELLLDVITHDLKNPAGVISGMADMMIDKFPGNEMAEVIKDSSDSLLQVVERAALLSQVALGEEIRKEEIDLSEIIKEVVNQFLPYLIDKGMNLENHMPETLSIKANPIVEEVFKNYISNAIKYASEGQRIIIEAFEENKFITVGIKDFGQSISDKDYQSIFIRSTQLEMGTKRGRGLGLAIVKRIAQAHNGKVWVEANKPVGNIFYLKIPKI
jgi:PAS domain S-box-containing protein